jgi:asparagine synthase (glutamine-hydrolysing)
MYRPTMDVSVAQAVAAECDQPHHVLELDRRFLAGIDEHFRHAVYASDGYLGLAGGAELYLNRKASLIAPTRVTGNWGGELMRGVRAFKFRVPKGDFVDRTVGEQITEVGETFRGAADIHPLSYTLFHQLPYQGYGRYAVERSQLLTRSPFLANGVVNAVYQAPVASRTSIELVLRVLMQRPGLLAIPTDTGRLGHSPRPISLLRQGYRRVLVKSEYLTSHGAPDWMAALSARLPLLERGFLGRDKFQHFRIWMRNELSSFVRDVLFRDDQRDTLAAWFDMRRVSMMVTDHIAGRANYTEEIDKLMTVAMLHKTFDSGGRLTVPALSNVHREMASELSS